MTYDPELDFDRSSLDDDQLRMLFTCCHPALPPEARMALTLRSVAGLTVPEIARAFLSSEDAMERRLTRARRKITRRPDPVPRPARRAAGGTARAASSRVVYLVYTEGHVATARPRAVRGDLCDEAIRLARLLARLMPDERSARTARPGAAHRCPRAARVSGDGSLVGSTSRTGRAGTARGSTRASACWRRALRLDGPGRTPSRPRSRRCTHRRRHGRRPTGPIAALYAALERFDRSPVVKINRAVAVSFAGGPEAGLEILDSLGADARLDRYQPLHAALAELRRRAGDAAGADTAYAAAIALSSNAAERAALERRSDDQPPAATTR